jgi:hypothetical protein
MRTLAIASLLILTAAPVMAATATDQNTASSDQSSATVPMDQAEPAATPAPNDQTARNDAAKSDPTKSALADPDAGVKDDGTPNAAVTNGGELKK